MESNNNPVPETPKSDAPAPEMANISAESANSPEPTTSLEPIPQPTKSSKSAIWCLVILAIVGIVAATVFAYLYFTTPTIAPTSAPNNNQSSTTPDEPTTTGETEITDTYVLRDLDNKIAILHNTTETGSTIRRIKLQYMYSYPLYTEGTLSEIARLAHLANSIVPDYYLSREQKEAIVNEQGYNSGEAELFKNVTQNAIKSNTMATKYLDLFGETLSKGAVNDQRHYCPAMFYDSTYDIYYNVLMGCGGTGPYTGVYYKNKYTADEEHAYVYVYTGTYNAEDDKIYCDILSTEPSESNLPAVCGEAENSNDFSIDATNYQNFAQYRFVFNKADDGTYYFSKVEKL